MSTCFTLSHRSACDKKMNERGCKIFIKQGNDKLLNISFSVGEKSVKLIRMHFQTLKNRFYFLYIQKYYCTMNYNAFYFSMMQKYIHYKITLNSEYSNLIITLWHFQ